MKDNRTPEEAAKKIHELYLECKDVFDPCNAMRNNEIRIADREEKLFYVAVSDFFIQQKQKRIIMDK